ATDGNARHHRVVQIGAVQPEACELRSEQTAHPKVDKMPRADDVVPQEVGGLDIERARRVSEVGLQRELGHVRQSVVEGAGAEDVHLGHDAAPSERIARRVVRGGSRQVYRDAAIEPNRKRYGLDDLVGPYRGREEVLVLLLPEFDCGGFLDVTVEAPVGARESIAIAPKRLPEGIEHRVDRVARLTTRLVLAREARYRPRLGQCNEVYGDARERGKQQSPLAFRSHSHFLFRVNPAMCAQRTARNL